MKTKPQREGEIEKILESKNWLILESILSTHSLACSKVDNRKNKCDCYVKEQIKAIKAFLRKELSSLIREERKE